MLSEALERASPEQLEEELSVYRVPISFHTPPDPSVFLGAWYEAAQTPQLQKIPPQHQARADAELQQEAHRCGISNAGEFTGEILRTVVDAVRIVMA